MWVLIGRLGTNSIKLLLAEKLTSLSLNLEQSMCKEESKTLEYRGNMAIALDG